MSQKQLNLGILAHVDAGKTTLTERLLYETGVIGAVGSVDDGTTQTDFLALERQRGITIRSAVASFTVGDVHVNLIDTPGHPDFIAEVERVLAVLDGAVLVISAVEGVQPQTRILMRALHRLRVPTLIFVNKIDRPGASEERVLQAISERLSPAIVPLGRPRGLGTRGASFARFDADDARFLSSLAERLAERDEILLAEYVQDEAAVSAGRLRAELARQTHRALVHPLFFGSALTGAGMEQLLEGIAQLLPPAGGEAEGPVDGAVFKIERGPGGEKIAYVRMLSGTIRTRDAVGEAKVTAIAAFERGGRPAPRAAISAGEIAKVWGLREVRVGDRIGTTERDGVGPQFAPPTLESVVVAAEHDDAARLRVALAQLAEQDPLIDVRHDDDRHELSVSLYGEVQKEVIEATLASDYGIAVAFHEVTPIYVERPVGSGEAVEILNADSNPFRATIGLHVGPAPIGSGVQFRMQVDARTVPLYVYKTLGSFGEHMEEYVHDALREGLYGWGVTDCTVTMTRCGYSVPDGPPSRRGPLSTAADFRKVTPIVVMRALERARTAVCEPTVHVRLEIPAEATATVTSALGRLGASVETSSFRERLAALETVMPAARADELRRQLARLTQGDGVLEATFAGYEPVSGSQPRRRRRGPNPLDVGAYAAALARRGAVGDR